MINLFGVERTLKLPNGDEFVEEGSVAVYEEKVGPKLVIEYKTEKGTCFHFRTLSSSIKMNT